MQTLQLLLFALLVYSLAVLSKTNPQKIIDQVDSISMSSNNPPSSRLAQIVEEIIEHSEIAYSRTEKANETFSDFVRELRHLRRVLDALEAGVGKFSGSMEQITRALATASSAINFQLATPLILAVQTLWMGWLMWRQTNTLEKQTKMHQEKYAKA